MGTVNQDQINQLIEKAWAVRKTHSPAIYFSAPSAKHYSNKYHSNQPNSFVNLSVTGSECGCRCAHCGGKLLNTMIPVKTNEEMRSVIDRLLDRGCRGILVSGGSYANGEVPLRRFVGAMRYAKERGLKVLAHGGLIAPGTAAELKEAGVDQVLLDVIGHERTIREVYHLDRKPGDYLESMLACQKVGLAIAPHVVIGLHFGRVLGEFEALEMIKEARPQTLVLVILTPTCGTEMADLEPPSIEEAALVIGTARVDNPDTPLTLGCARPPGRYRREIEKVAVDCGVNAIAYPDEATVEYARGRGLTTVFSEECCSLVVPDIGRDY